MFILDVKITKNALPVQLRSGVVYQYTCPKCNLGFYIGCTIRQLRVRVAAHGGISLGLPDFSGWNKGHSKNL